jgi:hypothetical protein
MLETVDRVANRAKRELVAKFPPAHRWAERRHRAVLDRYRPHLPAVGEEQRRRLDEVREQGIVVAPWGELGLPGVEELKPLLSGLADTLAGRPARSGDGDSTVRLGRDETLEDPRLFRWGLQDEVLDLVENYVGVPCRYYGALVHRELADSRAVSTRQWHRDIEDRRVLKILVWLNDVDVDGGPFTYVPLATSREVAGPLRYVGGFVDDERFASLVPPSEWRQATGPRWTAGMPDTAAIFHRAQAPVARDRYSVTFTWTSSRPVKVIHGEAWTRQQARRATAGLGPRQLEALPPALRAAAGGGL